jgi:hypothetical protein
MLFRNLRYAAKLDAFGAYRAGAAIHELTGVANLAFLFRRLPAANFGAEIFEKTASGGFEQTM